ncbi:MAG: pyridoxal phosphate-dependent aminotransferase [Candidatus Scatosoma sp.]
MNQRISARISAVSPSLTLAITAKAKAMKAAGEDVVSFGVGEPDFPTPAHIVDAAKRALDNGQTKYTPSSGLPALKKAICKKLYEENGLEYKPSQIIVSNGAKHSVFNVCYALLNEGDEAIIPAPYWLTYPEAVKLCGGVPVAVEGKSENGFKITAEQLENAVTPKTKLFIFNSPCNPTGAVYTKEEIASLAAVCVKHNIFVLSDEIYEKLLYDGAEHFSFAAASKEAKDLTVTVNGVSKTYAMTGFRVGYLAAPEDIAAAIDSFQSHATSNACTISQYAAIEALSSPEEEVKKMVDIYARRREKLLALIGDVRGADCVTPSGAFYAMMRVSALYKKEWKGKTINGSVDFAAALLDEEKVAVIPGGCFGADEYVRLSYSLSEEDIVKGMERIADFFRKVLRA